MSTDPSTKDLIKARAQFSRHSSTCSAHASGMCQRCLLHALADRLEELEAQRDDYFNALAESHALTRSPEPSDPDTNDVPERAESVEPEPENRRVTVEIRDRYQAEPHPDMGERLDPEPEDPWAVVEKMASFWPTARGDVHPIAAAVVDLRDRIEKLEARQDPKPHNRRYPQLDAYFTET